jgi:hypothetical protein
MEIRPSVFREGRTFRQEAEDQIKKQNVATMRGKIEVKIMVLQVNLSVI